MKHKIKVSKIKQIIADVAAKEQQQQYGDERLWTDACEYAEQFYGETLRATIKYDNDWD